MKNYIAEFLGTYILCLTMLLINKYYHTPLSMQVGIVFATMFTLAVFNKNDADFNPAITFMYYLDSKRSIIDLISFTLSQISAAALAFLTIRLIF